MKTFSAESGVGTRGGSRFSKPDFSGFKHIFVVDNVDPYGRLLCYVPDLQSDWKAYTELETQEVVIPMRMYEKSQPQESGKTPQIVKNDVEILTNELVTLRNCMWFMPTWPLENDPRDNERVPPVAVGKYHSMRVGSWVIGYFLDEDPQKPYWFPFTFSNNEDIIDNYHSNRDNGNTDWDTPSKKINIDVLREYYNGNLMEWNNNPNTNSYATVFHNPTGTIRSPKPGLKASVTSRLAGNLYDRNLPNSEIAHRFKMEYNRRLNEIELVTVGRKRLIMDEIKDYMGLISTNRHVLMMHDKEMMVKLASSQGHRLLMDDARHEVVLNTRNGHVFRQSDRERLVELYTSLKHRVVIDDLTQELKAVSNQGHRIVINDRTGIIEISTNNGYRVTISSLTGSIVMETAGGQRAVLQDIQLPPFENSLKSPQSLPVDDIEGTEGFSVLNRPIEEPVKPGKPGAGLIQLATTLGNLFEMNDQTKMVNIVSSGTINATSLQGPVNINSANRVAISAAAGISLTSSNLDVSGPTLFKNPVLFAQGTTGATN